MPMTAARIVKTAEKKAKAANYSEEALFAAMGTIPNTTPFETFTVSTMQIRFPVAPMAKLGRKLFETFKKYLKQAVCDDFRYCSKKEAVDKALDKYLPEIVKPLMKRIRKAPMPGWLAGMVAQPSTDVILVLLISWLIIKGCNELCKCPG